MCSASMGQERPSAVCPPQGGCLLLDISTSFVLHRGEEHKRSGYQMSGAVLEDGSLCNLNPVGSVGDGCCALPQCLAMVELTLVGWKDPVVLDLPTTD